jgi:hypothetical protein
MNTRILFAVAITVLLYGIWSWWSVRSEEGFAPFDINSQSYLTQEVEEAPIVAIRKQLAAAGPNSPSVAPPSPSPPVVLPEESPYDPQSSSYETADHPERLRHPERLYGPGLVNDETQTAVDSGVAGQAASITNQNLSQFGPEFAQNGGFFLDNGVIANDSSVSSSYSSV